MDITLTLVEHHVWLVGQLVDRVERRQALLDRPVQGGLDDKPTVRSLTAGSWSRVSSGGSPERVHVRRDDRPCAQLRRAPGSLVIAVLAADGVDDLRNGDPMLYFSEVRDQADHRG